MNILNRALHEVAFFLLITLSISMGRLAWALINSL